MARPSKLSSLSVEDALEAIQATVIKAFPTFAKDFEPLPQGWSLRVQTPRSSTGSRC
jgi:hypothetical protein